MNWSDPAGNSSEAEQAGISGREVEQARHKPAARETLLLRAGLGVLGVSAVLLLVALPGTSNAVMMAALVSAVVAGTLLAIAAVSRAPTDYDQR